MKKEGFWGEYECYGGGVEGERERGKKEKEELFVRKKYEKVLAREKETERERLATLIRLRRKRKWRKRGGKIREKRGGREVLAKAGRGSKEREERR